MYALISVFDKKNLLPFAEGLLRRGYTILASGGTYKYLLNLPDVTYIKRVEDITHFPEILGGRVKTLHPTIFGGILQQTVHSDLPDIQMVVVNLYPFEKVIAQPNVSETEVVENIDIGGHALLRAAAKNYARVKVVTDFNQKVFEMDNLELARQAWSYIRKYDDAIDTYYNHQTIPLKYGLNPSQTGSLNVTKQSGFEVLNGNLGYINVLDALLAWQLVRELRMIFNVPAVASYKHNSPAGVAIGSVELNENEQIAFQTENPKSALALAFARARNGDPLSSFGDFIALSHKVDVETAKLIKPEVSDGLIAPDYEPEALEILKKKKNGNFVVLQINLDYDPNGMELREMFGCRLSQSTFLTPKLQETINKGQNLSEAQKRDLLLANVTLKYTQSNSVAIAGRGMCIGIGAGQQNRVDCVKLATKKACLFNQRQKSPAIGLVKKWKEEGFSRQERVNKVMDFCNSFFNTKLPTELNAVLASDAFFPFPDSITEAFKGGVYVCSAPSGSVRDNDINKTAGELGVTVIYTSERLFTH